MNPLRSLVEETREIRKVMAEQARLEGMTDDPLPDEVIPIFLLDLLMHYGRGFWKAARN